jgi:hypothetical protein
MDMVFTSFGDVQANETPQGAAGEQSAPWRGETKRAVARGNKARRGGGRARRAGQVESARSGGDAGRGARERRTAVSHGGRGSHDWALAIALLLSSLARSLSFVTDRRVHRQRFIVRRSE